MRARNSITYLKTPEASLLEHILLTVIYILLFRILNSADRKDHFLDCLYTDIIYRCSYHLSSKTRVGTEENYGRLLMNKDDEVKIMEAHIWHRQQNN